MVHPLGKKNWDETLVSSSYFSYDIKSMIAQPYIFSVLLLFQCDGEM